MSTQSSIHAYRLSLALLLLVLTALVPAQINPFASHLPDNRIPDVVLSMSQFELSRALDDALNSPGDSIVLKLEAGLSVPVVPGVGVGGSVTVTAGVKLIEPGLYEMHIGRDVAANCKLAISDPLSLSVSRSQGGGIYLRFQGENGVVDGLQRLAMCAVLAPLSSDAFNLLERGQEAAQALADRLKSFDAAQILKAKREATFAKAEQVIAAFEEKAKSIRAKINSWSRKRGWFARKFVGGLLRTLDRIAPGKRAVETARRLLRRAEEAAEKIEALVEFAEAAALRAADNAAQAFEMLDVLATMQCRLVEYVHSIEFKTETAADLNIGIPLPVEIEQLKAGVSVGAAVEMKVRILFPRGGHGLRVKVSVSQTLKGSVSGDAFFASGEVACKRELDASCVISLEGEPRVEELTLSLSNDTSLTGSVAGAKKISENTLGLSTRYGVGRKVSYEIDLLHLAGRLEGAIDGLLALVDGDDAKGLTTALAGIEVKVKLQDRWVGKVGASFGASSAGMSVKLGAAATWSDLGDTAEATFTVGEVAQCIAATATGAANFVENAFSNATF